MKICIATLVLLFAYPLYGADQENDPSQQLYSYIENYDLVNLKSLLTAHERLPITDEQVKFAVKKKNDAGIIALYIVPGQILALCNIGIYLGSIFSSKEICKEDTENVTTAGPLAGAALSTSYLALYARPAIRSVKTYLTSRNILHELQARTLEQGTYNTLAADGNN